MIAMVAEYNHIESLPIGTSVEEIVDVEVKVELKVELVVEVGDITFDEVDGITRGTAVIWKEYNMYKCYTGKIIWLFQPVTLIVFYYNNNYTQYTISHHWDIEE